MPLAIVPRILLLQSLASSSSSSSSQRIDRASVVQRHIITLRGIESAPPLSTPLALAVGNGVLGFNADATGMQTLNSSIYSTRGADGFPLTTLSDWGWHSQPPPTGVDPFKSFAYTRYDTSTGAQVPYPMASSSNDPAVEEWLRSNPHRLDLIQVALRRRSDTSAPLTLGDSSGIIQSSAKQTLNPYTGELVSNFTLSSGASCTTRTVCHMDLDVLAWRLSSAALLPTHKQQVVLRVAFPYGTTSEYGGGSDWSSDVKHETTVVRTTATSALLHRRLDFDEYYVLCRWSAAGAKLVSDGPHSFYLDTGVPTSSTSSSTLEFSCLLSPPSARYPIDPTAEWLVTKSSATNALLLGEVAVPLYADTAAAAAAGWSAFWASGAFVDLADSRSSSSETSEIAHYVESRALELERRIILSLFLTRLNSAGSTPPQETGYVKNSWYGKHHHEMRWFHHTHFALWNRYVRICKKKAQVFMTEFSTNLIGVIYYFLSYL